MLTEPEVPDIDLADVADTADGAQPEAPHRSKTVIRAKAARRDAVGRAETDLAEHLANPAERVRPVSADTLPTLPALAMARDPGCIRWRACTKARKARNEQAIKSAEELMAAFDDWLLFLDTTGIHWVTKRKRREISRGGAVTEEVNDTEDTPRHAPPTKRGFASFIGVGSNTLVEWANPARPSHREDLVPALREIDDALWDNVVAMAAAGLGDPSTLAKLAGLAERREETRETHISVTVGGDAIDALRSRLAMAAGVAAEDPAQDPAQVVDAVPEAIPGDAESAEAEG